MSYWVVIVSYLIGSIPFSYLVARCWKGIDIRKCGSGNVGMTNVWRNAGPAAGLLAAVAVLEALADGVFAHLGVSLANTAAHIAGGAFG